MIVPLRMGPPSSNTVPLPLLYQLTVTLTLSVERVTGARPGAHAVHLDQLGGGSNPARAVTASLGLGESCCAAGTAAYLLADCAEQSRCAERSTWQQR